MPKVIKFEGKCESWKFAETARLVQKWYFNADAVMKDLQDALTLDEMLEQMIEEDEMWTELEEEPGSRYWYGMIKLGGAENA